ncbi:MAG: AraC family transcriptional regulator [Terrimicrobiaceae bacterium]|nr:AraC family transcriptional regulator [Terrimicrobiaceae bacterium]
MKHMEKSPPTSEPHRASFGDVRAEGFRITRWDAREEPAERHWFDAHSLVLCLNLSGNGRFHDGVAALLAPGAMVVVCAPKRRLQFERMSGERHRFVALEMRRPWVSRWLADSMKTLREPVRRFLEGPGSGSAASETVAMPAHVSRLAADVLRPPHAFSDWACWHHAKALEMVSHALIVNEAEEPFCERTKRVGRERAARAREILLADIENPPSLSDLGRRVGCSPFYLSRIFRQETGLTLTAFLRRARLDRAAELLRSGEANVTEAAMTVGYSSLSHFSKAFAEAFGCCPCLYGRRPREASITPRTA